MKSFEQIKVEIETWIAFLAKNAEEYRKQGMSKEEAEEKAMNDIRREMRK